MGHRGISGGRAENLHGGPQRSGGAAARQSLRLPFQKPPPAFAALPGAHRLRVARRQRPLPQRPGRPLQGQDSAPQQETLRDQRSQSIEGVSGDQKETALVPRCFQALLARDGPRPIPLR